MHEFALAQSVLQLALDAAREHGLSRISEVRVLVGELAGVSSDALAYAWEFLRGGDGIATAAELALTHTPGAGECAACGYTGAVNSIVRICPRCGAWGVRLTAGQEFMVTGISGE